MKLGLEALTGKALPVWLEFISETGGVYKCKLSLALIYLADFINKLKTNKFNSFLLNGFNYKKSS